MGFLKDIFGKKNVQKETPHLTPSERRHRNNEIRREILNDPNVKLIEREKPVYSDEDELVAYELIDVSPGRVHKVESSRGRGRTLRR